MLRAGMLQPWQGWYRAQPSPELTMLARGVQEGSRELCGALISPLRALPSKVGAFLVLHEPKLPGQSEPYCISVGTRASLGQPPALLVLLHRGWGRGCPAGGLGALPVLLLHPDPSRKTCWDWHGTTRVWVLQSSCAWGIALKVDTQIHCSAGPSTQLLLCHLTKKQSPSELRQSLLSLPALCKLCASSGLREVSGFPELWRLDLKSSCHISLCPCCWETVSKCVYTRHKTFHVQGREQMIPKTKKQPKKSELMAKF